MIQVNSEIGKLKKVMLHRPGNEIMRVHPLYLPEMLMEDTPYLEQAQKEHDTFANILRDNGVEVVYMRDLFTQAVSDQAHRKAFVDEFVAASGLPSLGLANQVKEYYLSLSVEDFVEAIYDGILRCEFDGGSSLGNLTYTDDLYLVKPLPNCYFTRDSSINVADSVILSHMSMTARKREPILAKYIHRYSNEYKDNPTTDLYDEHLPYGIEGGDFLILSDKAVCIGCTERTQPGAIEYVAQNLFAKGFEAVIAFEMPRGRDAMHLDGMLTMVDVDTFIYNPLFDGRVNLFKLTPGKDGVKTESIGKDWKKALENALGVNSVRLIPCGNGGPITGMWELWNLGSNVLTIEPGKVVGYDRNAVTLDLLDKAGIEVHTFSGSELSRGRGGARCMSMPIYRENL